MLNTFLFSQEDHKRQDVIVNIKIFICNLNNKQNIKKFDFKKLTNCH